MQPDAIVSAVVLKNTKMKLLTAESLIELSADHKGPCLSLYQPTHRHYPGNQQDPIRFRNLVTEMRQSIEGKCPAETVSALLSDLDQLLGDDLLDDLGEQVVKKAGRMPTKTGAAAISRFWKRGIKI